MDTLTNDTCPAATAVAGPSKIGSMVVYVLRGALAFSLVFSAIAGLRQTDFLDGKVALVMAAIVLTLAPTAASLSRRIFINLVILMGLVPLTWWLPERFIVFDHATLALATSSGLIAGWVFARPFIWSRMRSIVPKVEGMDAIPVIGAALSAMSLWTMLRVSKADDALTLFLTRWDYQSHFNIYEMIRTHGAVIPVIPRISSGETWGFAEYPQGFHALVATLSELQRPHLTTLDLELVSFLNLQALVAVMTVTMVLAGLCSLSSIRRRATLAAPIIAVTAAVWIYGLGTIPLYEGFSNFYLACGMAVAAAIVLAMFSPRIPAVGMATLAAAIVGVFSNWMVLATFFAVPLALFLLHRARNFRRTSARSWILIGAWSAIALVGSLLPVLQAGPVLTKTADVVKAVGGILPPDMGLSVASVALVLLLGLAIAGQSSPSRRFGPVRSTSAAITLGTLLPVAVCVWLGISQIRTNGEVAYYFYKYLVALVLFSWPASVVAVGALMDLHRESLGNGPRLRVKVGLCLLAASATQVFGFSATSLREVGLPPTATSVVFMEEQKKLIEATPGYVVRLLSSAKMAQPVDTVYITASNSIDPVLAARWQWGMRGAATQKTTDMSSYLDRLHKVPDQDPGIISELLLANPGTTALVDVEIYAGVKAFLDAHGLNGRVIPVG